MVSRGFDFSRAAVTEIRTLVARAAARDAGAAATLVDGMAPVIRRRVACALARRRDQARGRALRPDLEDLVQETFAGLFADEGRALRAWDPARGLGFLGFVGMLAEREVGMRMRTRRRHPWTEDPTAEDTLMHLGGSTESLALQIERRDLVRRVVARLAERLSPLGRRYFELLFLDAQPVQAIAAETGASADALYAWRSRLTRLVREVRGMLDEHADPASPAESACAR